MDYRKDYVDRIDGVFMARDDLISNGNVTENSPRASHPLNVTTTLKNHQLATLCRMEAIERSGQIASNGTTVKSTFGVVTDKVGSGKTITMCAHISRFRQCLNECSIPMTYGPHIERELHDIYELVDTNVIVVPHTVYKQWIDTVSHSTDLTFYGIGTREDVKDRVDDYANYDVIIVSGSFYRMIHSQFCGYKVQRLIFDEADTINLVGCKRIMASFYWFISSSIHNILYPNGGVIHSGKTYIDGVRKTGFIKDLCLDISGFYMFETIIVKCADSFVDSSFRLPDPILTTIVCQAPAYLDIVANIVNSEVMDNLHAGDIQGALKNISNMGIEIQQGENIVSYATRSFQLRLEDLHKKLVYWTTIHVSERERENKVKRINTDIESMNVRIRSIQERVANMSKDVCGICLDICREPVSLLNCCSNFFCYACIETMMKQSGHKSCPMCRRTISYDTMTVVGEFENDKEKRKTKNEVIVDLIKENPNGKFLIFSTNDNTFQKLGTLLMNANIKRCERVAGSRVVLEKIIDQYKHGDLNVLMLNGQQFACGINLQETSHIIFYHKMSKDMEMQIMGRAHRYGRKGPLRVIYLKHNIE